MGGLNVRILEVNILNAVCLLALISRKAKSQRPVQVSGRVTANQHSTACSLCTSSPLLGEWNPSRSAGACYTARTQTASTRGYYRNGVTATSHLGYVNRFPLKQQLQTNTRAQGECPLAALPKIPLVCVKRQKWTTKPQDRRAESCALSKGWHTPRRAVSTHTVCTKHRALGTTSHPNCLTADSVTAGLLCAQFLLQSTDYSSMPGTHTPITSASLN